MKLFNILRQPVTISVTVFSNLTNLTTVKQVFFHYQVGSLVDHRASKPYTLAGPPALRLVVLLLDNQLYMYFL